LYNWKIEPDIDPTTGLPTAKHDGFIAQEVQQVFPDLVSQDPNTQLLSLNYIGLIPYTIEAIKEMNLNITSIDDLTRPNTWRDAITAWLADSANGIQNIFSNKVTTNELCVGTTCVTQQQFLQMVQNSGSSGTTTVSGDSGSGGGSSSDSSGSGSDSDSGTSGDSSIPPSDDSGATQSPSTDGTTVTPPDNTPSGYTTSDSGSRSDSSSSSSGDSDSGGDTGGQ
jgi:hypothetical protein